MSRRRVPRSAGRAGALVRERQAGTAKLPGLGKSPAGSREGAWAGVGGARGATGAAPGCAQALAAEQALPGGTAGAPALPAVCSFPSAFSKVQTSYALRHGEDNRF